MTDWDGTWCNELGSELVLRVADGVVSGSYRTQVGRPDTGETFRVCGFVTGDLIVVAADFGAHGSLTSWAGRRVAGADGTIRIDALWHLLRSHDDAGAPLPPWASTLSGSARFARTAPP